VLGARAPVLDVDDRVPRVRAPVVGRAPTVPTLTTSVSATVRCQGIPVWVHSRTSAPLAVVRIRSSSSSSEPHRKSLIASGEPWTAWTSSPATRSRHSSGSFAIHAAKSREVEASVWSYMTCAKWLSRSSV
jgi:hypothetical protein